MKVKRKEEKAPKLMPKSGAIKHPIPILIQKYTSKTTNRGKGKAGKSTMKLVTDAVKLIIKGLPLFVV
jgi:hypothetical protein